MTTTRYPGGQRVNRTHTGCAREGCTNRRHVTATDDCLLCTFCLRAARAGAAFQPSQFVRTWMARFGMDVHAAMVLIWLEGG